jgi:flagellar biosynthetic protein FlhB
MADNDVSRDDRQLPASARRLQKAAEDGQVPRSRDAGHALLLSAALAALTWLGGGVAQGALDIVRAGMRFTPAQVFEPARLVERLHTLGASALGTTLPTVGLLVAAAVVASMIPGGPVFSGKPVAVDFGRLDPLRGFGRLLSKDAAVDAVKLLAVASALVLTAWQFTGGSLVRFGGLSSQPLEAGLARVFDTLGTGMSWLVGVLVCLAAIDAPLQWYRHRVSLRMTHQEVREEAKEAEGDPHQRGRIRARQREVGRARMLAAVPSADVVVTNPTHYAVAIRYDESRMGAPRVVAKGVDLLATRIRELAAECGVPMLESPPLARALYAHVEVDREIPATLYAAVAQVLAYVYQLRHFVPGRDRVPVPPSGVDLPPGLDPQERAE